MADGLFSVCRCTGTRTHRCRWFGGCVAGATRSFTTPPNRLPAARTRRALPPIPQRLSCGHVSVTRPAGSIGMGADSLRSAHRLPCAVNCWLAEIASTAPTATSFSFNSSVAAHERRLLSVNAQRPEKRGHAELEAPADRQAKFIKTLDAIVVRLAPRPPRFAISCEPASRNALQCRYGAQRLEVLAKRFAKVGTDQNGPEIVDFRPVSAHVGTVS